MRALVVSVYPTDYTAEVVETEGERTGPAVVFDGADAERSRIDVQLHEVSSGFSKPVDIQFPPGERERMVVVEQEGGAWLLTGEGFAARQRFLSLDVLTTSEQGLLGITFHPGFAENGRFYTNAVVALPSGEFTQILEWRVEPAAEAWAPEAVGELLKLRQPYPNHNAGQLAFGPDGHLYIGFGDGGWRNDPHGHGQNGASWLGSMLRVQVGDPGAWTVPADNPFLGDGAIAPEAWAIGLRNPWRYSFDPAGRMIIADVGQDTTEEIHIAAAGDNLGWATREGRRCFPPETTDCQTAGLVEPIYTYPRTEGISVTGGYVVTDPDAGALKGRYVFGDFASGRIWALELPATVSPGDTEATAHALGRWGLLISTFGRDTRGRVYVADFSGGTIYRIEG